MAHGSAFDDELQLANGALQAVRGPVSYKEIKSIAIRIVQRHVNGAGAMAAAAGEPKTELTPQLAKSWVLPADTVVNAGRFVDGPAQASAVALVVEDDDSLRVIEWSHDLLLAH
jgi:hypothetical protein